MKGNLETKYQYISILFLFGAVSVFWYTYQFNAYHHLGDLTLTNQLFDFLNWINILSTAENIEPEITSQALSYTGQDGQIVFMATSVFLSSCSFIILCIQKIKYGHNKLFLPLSLLSLVLIIFVVRMSYVIGLFY